MVWPLKVDQSPTPTTPSVNYFFQNFFFNFFLFSFANLCTSVSDNKKKHKNINIYLDSGAPELLRRVTADRFFAKFCMLPVISIDFRY